MNVFLYLLHRTFFRTTDFFHHWYIDGSRALGHRFVNSFEALDETMALRITLRHFWEPLYGDYSVVGRVLGLIFRTGRALIAFVVYAVLAVIFGSLYIVWLLLPFVPLFFSYRSLGLPSNLP